MTDKFQIKKFYPCYFAFMISGSVALILGAILPYIIEETGISFAVAGSLLSVFAMGNFLASFVYPPLSKLLGRKAAFITAALLQPAGLITVTLSSDISVLLVVFFILGISRGCNSIFNNAYVNENSDGGATALNILHMIFAVGAFTAPVCLSGFVKAGLGWRFELYFLAAAGLLAVILLLRLKMKEALITNTGKDYSDQKKPKPFWKCSVFYVSGFLLFFYLGLENCVNGWFKTYFKVSEIMSDGFANSLVGFTWAAVLLGRLVTANLAARINPKKLVFADCIAAAVFFILLTSTKNLTVITVSILGLGFFFAGIYPTTVSNCRSAIYGSDLGMSMLLAVSAAGGIITPQIVGYVADKTGLAGAISLLSVNVIVMIVLSIMNLIRKEEGKPGVAAGD